MNVAPALFALVFAAFPGVAAAQVYETPKPERPRTLRGPVIVPTAGISFMFNLSPDDQYGADASFPLWLGVSTHPQPQRISPFTSVGVEIDFKLTQGHAARRQATEYIPEMRSGFAWLSPPDRYSGVLFPDGQVYVIGGWHVPGDDRRGGARLGLGVTSPYPLIFGMTSGACVPVPTTLELVYDVHRGDQPARWSLRYGYQF